MNEREFCYWLKGFFEILSAGPKVPDKLVLTAEQVEMIDKHLRSVFQEKIMTLTSIPVSASPDYNPFPFGPTCGGTTFDFSKKPDPGPAIC